jgi:hypothetical protein
MVPPVSGGSPLPLALEKLDSPFVFLGGGLTFESAKVSAPAGFWVFLPRVQPIPSRGKFADHGLSPLF